MPLSGLGKPVGGAWLTYHWKNGNLATNYAAGSTYVYSADGQVLVTANVAARAAFYLDPADLAVSGYSTRMRLRMMVTTAATAPTGTFTAEMYPVSGSGGAAEPTITVGSAVGFNTAIGSMAATSRLVAVGTEQAAPSAGAYVLGVTFSAIPAQIASIFLHLQYRYL